MKREQAAAALTVLVIVGVVVALAIRTSRGGPPTSDVKPSSVVFDLFDQAKAGDAGGYLACFEEGLRRSVESSKQDMGDAAFKQHLVTVGTAVKGVSVTEERADAKEARLRVELVYADRTHNDVQTFTVVRKGSRWLIASMSGASQLRMPVPYGTPAYPLEQGGDERKTKGGEGVAAEAAPTNSKGGG
ncbi:MAG: hypothetical protein FJX75_18775 [Armatimonadetes bacterium]|nr:hypothetical protein [Armatimonadota bacterium]